MLPYRERALAELQTAARVTVLVADNDAQDRGGLEACGLLVRDKRLPEPEAKPLHLKVEKAPPSLPLFPKIDEERAAKASGRRVFRQSLFPQRRERFGLHPVPVDAMAAQGLGVFST